MPDMALTLDPNRVEFAPSGVRSHPDLNLHSGLHYLFRTTTPRAFAISTANNKTAYTTRSGSIHFLRFLPFQSGSTP
ncbi:hypothetical protein [Aeromonas enterica]